MLVEHIKNILSLLREVSTKRGRNVSDIEARLTFMKSGFLMKGYIPTIRNEDLGKGFIRELVEYEREAQSIFTTDRSESSGDNMRSFALISSRGEDGDSVSAAKVLILFYTGVVGTIESRDSSFLQYMEVTRLIPNFKETLGCACPWDSTADDGPQTEKRHWHFGARKSTCKRTIWDGASRNFTRLCERGESKS